MATGSPKDPDAHDVIITSFRRSTIDTFAHIYVVIIVAMIIGQQVSPLEFKMFSYTSSEHDGAVHDFCSPEPLYGIDPNVIQGLYNSTFPGVTVFPPPKQQVQEMMLNAGGIYGAVPPFNLFSVPDRHFCIGPEHYASAYKLRHHESIESVFWTYVDDNNAAVYHSYDREMWNSALLLVFSLPVWVYIICRFIYELKMMWDFHKYENHLEPEKVARPQKIESVILFNFFGNVLPFLLNSAAFALLIAKLMGVILSDASGIAAIAALYGAAVFSKWIPDLLRRIKLYRMTKNKIIYTRLVRELTIKQIPTDSVAMSVFCSFTSIAMIIIISLYISNDLPGMRFRVLDKQCTEYDGRASTYDSCVDSSGVGYRSTTSHYLLGWLCPILLLIVWRIVAFGYYMHAWEKFKKKDVYAADAQLQAGMSFMAQWRIVYPKSASTDTYAKSASADPTADTTDFDIRFKITAFNTATDVFKRVILISRFMIPLLLLFVGILLGLLKLSQYALWGGCPWWVIGILFSASVLIAITAEVLPEMHLRKAASLAKSNLVRAFTGGAPTANR